MGIGRKEGGGDWGYKGERWELGRKERGAVWVIGGFMLYGGLIWGMWGAQGVYMAG